MTHSATSGGLLGELRVASIVDTDGLEDAEVGKRQGLGRALLIEAISAVPAVMLSVGEGECGSASHTDFGVDPFRRLGSVSVGTSPTNWTG